MGLTSIRPAMDRTLILAAWRSSRIFDPMMMLIRPEPWQLGQMTLVVGILALAMLYSVRLHEGHVNGQGRKKRLRLLAGAFEGGVPR